MDRDAMTCDNVDIAKKEYKKKAWDKTSVRAMGAYSCGG